jgi:hypothetical protein
MAGVDQQRVRSAQSPLRCPYCHEGLSPLVDAWVACKACLGRHHSGCWEEGGRCSACGGSEHLLGERPAEAADPVRAEAGRERVFRILDLDEQGDDSDLLGFVWSLATLGLVPILEAEGRLNDHVREHRGAQDTLRLPGGSHLEARVRRYRTEAFDRIERGARRRSALTAMALAMCLAAVLSAGILAVGGVGSAGLAWVPWLVGGAVGLWATTLSTAMVMHTRAVRRHELKQLYLEMLAQGSEYDTAVALREHRAFWGEAQWDVARIATVSLILPVLAPILAVVTLRRPMRAHLARELEVEALRPRMVPPPNHNSS